jgi:hypothetical protein
VEERVTVQRLEVASLDNPEGVGKLLQFSLGKLRRCRAMACTRLEGQGGEASCDSASQEHVMDALRASRTPAHARTWLRAGIPCRVQ